MPFASSWICWLIFLFVFIFFSIYHPFISKKLTQQRLMDDDDCDDQGSQIKYHINKQSSKAFLVNTHTHTQTLHENLETNIQIVSFLSLLCYLFYIIYFYTLIARCFLFICRINVFFFQNCCSCLSTFSHLII